MLKTRLERGPWRWQGAAALTCFLIAILAVVGGTVLTTSWILNEQIHPLLHSIGLTLLIIALPLLILGGHCLDLMDQKNKKWQQRSSGFSSARRATHQQNGTSERS